MALTSIVYSNECSEVLCIDCLVHLVGFNTDPSTSVSTRFCVLIVFSVCVIVFVVILSVEVCIECCV